LPIDDFLNGEAGRCFQLAIDNWQLAMTLTGA
jgi:hypothetical protein